MGHAVRFGNDDIQKTVGHVLRDIAASIPQGFGVTADIGQRSAKLVGDVGNELLASFFVAVLLRDVMQHDQSAALFVIGEGG